MTDAELHRRVENMAGALKNEFKVVAGDRVIIYMPMVI
jgi:acyl-coenzyme A synthetase/AMP-(fatty) acid ligase